MLLKALYATPLREITALLQREGEGHRRWFTSPTADLFVWLKPGRLDSFEFCYDKPRREKSVRWSAEQGLRFFRIDDGEDSPLHNRTPIAWPAQDVDRETAALRFESLGAGIEAPVYRFVLGRIWLGEPKVPEPEAKR